MHFPNSNRLPISNWDGWSLPWPPPAPLEYTLSTQFSFHDYRIEEVAPFLTHFMTRYEVAWDNFPSWTAWMRINWRIPILVSVGYLLAVPLGIKIMRNRPPFDIKYLLFMWNLCLAVFSIIGTVRILPVVFYSFFANGPLYHICRRGDIGYGYGSVGLWCVLFVLSKYAELVDTLFLVLRKKPVPFLHWYHHASVLLLSIGTMMVYGPSGIIMIAMNYFVHSIMYTYYAIAAVRKPPSWGKYVTVLQIAQMVGGLAMLGLIVFGAHYVPNCEVQAYNVYAIGFIYLSYLILFVQFYINRYRADRSVSKKVL